ncbi:MAG: hypothetical protein QE485_14025 [Acidovorax sp.]|uniref:hypothetical protein n=1 Tax=Acidovorax sp. TaxID=1872122 RepID=UPI002628EC4E|nr:hypothetical protein [Acidovorax sp.]MDH4418336.1 hypothetical protein [Acidovorax sp.]
MDFESRLVKGLDAALKTWSESPNAFSVARNGGAELAIRSSLLYELECKTGCIAFTEAGGNRIDIALRKGAERDGMYLIELKNNILHKHQQRYIKSSRDNACKQLFPENLNGRKVEGRFYVHLIVGLVDRRDSRKPADSAFLGVWNNILPEYKRFQCPKDLCSQLKLAKTKLQDLEPRSYRIAAPDEGPAARAPAHAVLHCWLVSVNSRAAGNFEAVKGWTPRFVQNPYPDQPQTKPRPRAVPPPKI